MPPNLLLVGLFIICCFISLAMGTSMGTVSAVTPIAIGIADQTTIPLLLALGATIGGAMFGDNLSFISDTTIAATRTQGVRMKDKFTMNFLIVLPAAILNSIVLGILSLGDSATIGGHSFNIFEILPYIAVIITALIGVNVIIVLVGGIVFAAVIGMINGSFTPLGVVDSMSDGAMNMADIAIIAVSIGGLVEIIRRNGGIDYLLNLVISKIKSRKGAEFGISGLVSALDVGIGNNTLAILIAGPLSKKVSKEYGVAPSRTASLLDIYGAVFTALVPYGGQALAAGKLASVSPITIAPYEFYPIGIGIMGIISIMLGIPKGEKPNKSKPYIQK